MVWKSRWLSVLGFWVFVVCLYNRLPKTWRIIKTLYYLLTHAARGITAEIRIEIGIHLWWPRPCLLRPGGLSVAGNSPLLISRSKFCKTRAFANRSIGFPKHRGGSRPAPQRIPIYLSPPEDERNLRMWLFEPQKFTTNYHSLLDCVSDNIHYRPVLDFPWKRQGEDQPSRSHGTPGSVTKNRPPLKARREIE